MPSYICITHVLDNRTEAERLSDTLIAYGFHCRRVHEKTETQLRANLLFGATRVIALTSEEAAAEGSIAEDLTRLLKKGRSPICVSLGKNELDARFCRKNDTSGLERCLDCIPYPAGDHPDVQAVGQFIHRLLICRLARIENVFSALRLRRDDYGRAVMLAVAAHRGDRDAAYALGCAYECGKGVPVLENEAAKWIRRAADQGQLDARLHLGELYLSGWGVEPDELRALELFSAAADIGDRRGEYRLGLCYLNGVGVVTDPIRAIYHLRHAARWGYPPALFRLALLIRDGIGVPADPHLALRYLYEACREGAAAEAARPKEIAEATAWLEELVGSEKDTEEGETDLSALYALSDLTEDGATDSAVASATVAEYPLPPSLYGDAASRTNKRVALRTLRPRLLSLSARRRAAAASTRGGTGQPFARSRYEILRRPEASWITAVTRQSHALAGHGGQAQGHPALHMDRYDIAMGTPFDLADVAVALGGLLETGGSGNGVYELYPNPTRALVWYRYALRRGSSEALYRLAEAYRRGHGTLPDPAWAVELYRMSTYWGDARGQFALAVAYERGIGIKPDMTEAIRQYERAAASGYPAAQNNLGGCYEYGIGVAQNILTAVEWYTHAANGGSPEAMCRLGLCCECGRGVPVDYARAFEWYKKAEALGSAYACYRLGVCYEQGHFPASESRVGEPLPSALADIGLSEVPLEPLSDSAIGRELVDEEPTLSPHPVRLAEALRAWKRAAESGSADAAYAVAMCYAHGYGIRPDRARAMLYLKDAADGGCLQAICRLAFCSLEGNGAVPDSVAAKALLETAVQLWHNARAVYLANTAPMPLCALSPTEAAADALYMLGYCLLEGIGHTLPSENRSRDERICQAAPLLMEAADMGHVGAWILLGDLYAYEKRAAEKDECNALFPIALQTGSAEEKAHYCYARAIGVSAVRRSEPCPLSADGIKRLFPTHAEVIPERERTPILPAVPTQDRRLGGLLASGADRLGICSVPALKSLAREILLQHVRSAGADTAARDGDAERALQEAWRYLEDAAKQGSADARLGLAQCTYYGWGVEKNAADTLRYLQEAARSTESGVTAAMWLGDFYRTGRGGVCRTEDADDAYLRGLFVTLSGSEVGPYILEARKILQQKPEREARADLLYRLASFRSIYLSDKANADAKVHVLPAEDRRETFSYFAEAVLLGHTEARSDWARIYAYESHYPDATAPAAAGSEKKVSRKRLTLRKRRETAEAPLRDHRMWLADYYTDLWLEPKPFEHALQSVALASDLPAHMTSPVTPEMMANALNYLGECFFDGSGIARSYPSAVRCFSEVAEMGKSIPRGTPVPEAIVWAQYSLAYCLLNGKGAPRNAREAVRLLTLASKTHPDACFLLGKCHETGVGVDKTDLREAIKYYRRASQKGHRKALAKVGEIEAYLRELADTAEKRRK